VSEIEMSLSFPLDDDGFFRRECPLCHREFKVLLEENELPSLAQEGIGSYLLETQEEATGANENEETESEFTCPYCGQRAPRDSWWTQEQLAYIGAVAQNIIAKMVNEQLIRPLKRMSRRHSSGLISLRFEGEEMKQQELWISPEVNDMEIFDLPCCYRRIKMDESWSSVVHCFFCGFPYEPDDADSHHSSRSRKR
jgi:hypothetical protein